jgi:single-strand DNA-binding protein
MAMINSVVMVGNLTRDAEIKYFNNGNAIVKFSIAQNRRKKQGDAWVDEAMFFDISFGGKGAEAVHKYLTKGKQVAVQGELRQDRWEQDGQPRSKVFVSAFELQLLGGNAGGERSGPSGPSGQSGASGPGRDSGGSGGYESFGGGRGDERFEDDIPF